MPTRQAAAAAAEAQASCPLGGCKIAFRGNISKAFGHSQSSLSDAVKSLGGEVTSTVTRVTTHVVCTKEAYNDAKAVNVTQGKAERTLLSPQWILDLKEGKEVDKKKYLWTTSNTAGSTASPIIKLQGSTMPPLKDSKAGSKPAQVLSGKKSKELDVVAYPDWAPGTPVPYAALCAAFSLIEMTKERLAIIKYCSYFLRQVMRLTPEDLLSAVLLMINKLAPDYAGIELGIGESLILKVIVRMSGCTPQVIKADQREIGDLGLVAVKRLTRPASTETLTVKHVYQALMDIATVTGNGAQEMKVHLIKKLLSAANDGKGKIDIAKNKDKGGPSEAKFIVRFLEGKLRIGLAEETVLLSLSQAIVYHEAQLKGKVPSTSDIEKGTEILKTVYRSVISALEPILAYANFTSELPSYNIIIPAMLEHGILELQEKCKLQPGVPLKPMLAKPTKVITEVLDRFNGQAFTCEYKYDGERAQIHYIANKVARIFSRNSEDLSKKYPDVLATLQTWLKKGTESFVLDCEVVAWDEDQRKVLPFQQLITRKKKDVKVEDVKVKVCIFAFDLLYLNGEPAVRKSLHERRELLREAFVPIEGKFAFATYINCQELGDIQDFLDKSIKASCEGLMVKMLDGTESGYEPSKRSRNWLKIKKDYLSGIGDSLDLVVLGAYYGKGKRTAVYGTFLLACYDQHTNTYETVCNIGTGFSEKVLGELYKSLSETTIGLPKPYYSHSTGGQHQPDVWFEPRFVWEVRTADLTLSPRYKAGWKEGVDPSGERGISLRFPRFIKVRDDRKPDEATSSRQVAEMYRKQNNVTTTGLLAPEGPSRKPKTIGCKDAAEAPSKPATKPRRNGKAAVKPNSGDEPPREEYHKQFTIPLDDFCPAKYNVYVDCDGTPWDASLNMSNSTENNNKFYRIQIIHDPESQSYYTWTRWGRIGEDGQNRTLGNNTLQDAKKQFKKKFKQKSGLSWQNRSGGPISGKYAFIERSYNPNSDDNRVANKKEVDYRPAECMLEKPIQDLMTLIFNQKHFQITLSALNYDGEKLPLGKLSSATIANGFQQLKDLASLIDNPTLAASRWKMPLDDAKEHLSNTYYSLIPHAFGRKRPIIISDYILLRKEIELLESLSDMKDATEIINNIKGKSSVHPLEQQFRSLRLQEMTVLDHETEEFARLSKYLSGSRGATHKISYQIEHIFRVERNGEKESFSKLPYTIKKSNRRLLWHGSRATNFGGILSQGLRIAPPEAPASGYMFGKGIYLADVSSKSANYCVPGESGGCALLLLCEAELGTPMLKLRNGSYEAGEEARKKNIVSTWGEGKMRPTAWIDAGCIHKSLEGVKMPDIKSFKRQTEFNGPLLYNEYICYDIAQVKLRYLFRVKVR